MVLDKHPLPVLVSVWRPSQCLVSDWIGDWWPSNVCYQSAILHHWFIHLNYYLLPVMPTGSRRRRVGSDWVEMYERRHLLNQSRSTTPSLRKSSSGGREVTSECYYAIILPATPTSATLPSQCPAHHAAAGPKTRSKNLINSV